MKHCSIMLARLRQLAAVATGGYLLLLLLGTTQPFAVLGAQPKNGREAWNRDTAFQEVRRDVDRLLVAYDEDRARLNSTLEMFLDTRVKDIQKLNPKYRGFRAIAVWGNGLADLYEMPGHDKHGEIYSRLMEVASLLRRAQTTTHAYVEDRIIRGWPMVIDVRDSEPTFDSYQFGHIGRAMALAARISAERGDHGNAASLLEPVLWYLHDGFLSDDAETSRLDEDNRVVWVPQKASEGRKERHLQVTSGLQRRCISEPLPYNRGLAVAGAAMAAVRAIGAVDWEAQHWTMKEWSLKKCRRKLGELVRDNAMWFREAMWEPPPAGFDEERDNYRGRNGTSWVLWKYRDYSGCPKFQGTDIDRLEDIDHGGEDVAFVADYRQWVDEDPKGIELSRTDDGRVMFPKSLVRRMIVAFLNRGISDYGAPASMRFACDISGVNDRNGWGNSEKQCGSSRSWGRGRRPRSAVGWLPLALTARKASHGWAELRCDVLRLVEAVLPLTLLGDDEFDTASFGVPHGSWAPIAIQTNYYFYNFRAELSECPSQ